MMVRKTLTLVVALAVLTGCGSDAEPADGASPTSRPQPRPSTAARLTVLEPTPGQVVTGDEVRVRLQVDDFEIIEEVTTQIDPGEGHVHLKLDGETITLLAGLDETVPDIQPGAHLLEVELVAGDHGPFNPRVIQTVSFTAE